MKKILFLILFSIVCIKSNAQLDVSMIGVHSSGDILMFDQVTPDAKTIGYSLGKKQSTAYTGHGAKLRRASDNTELIVDYVNNIFDRASAKSFCASTTCFCHILYDNSGNGNNAVQDTATKQAQYVDSDFFNYPSLVFSSGTSQYYWLTTPITLTSGFSWQACMKKTSGNILGFLGTYNTTNSYLMSYTTDNVYTSEPNRQRLSSGLGGMGKGSILVTYATGGSFFQNNKMLLTKKFIRIIIISDSR